MKIHNVWQCVIFKRVKYLADLKGVSSRVAADGGRHRGVLHSWAVGPSPGWRCAGAVSGTSPSAPPALPLLLPLFCPVSCVPRGRASPRGRWGTYQAVGGLWHASSLHPFDFCRWVLNICSIFRKGSFFFFFPQSN